MNIIEAAKALQAGKTLREPIVGFKVRDNFTVVHFVNNNGSLGEEVWLNTEAMLSEKWTVVDE
jgi:hypothetical protein